MSKNYNLFEKHFNRISATTIKKFGSQDKVRFFLLALCESGNVVAALRKSGNKKDNKVEQIDISPLEIHKVIHSDKYLGKCTALALNIAGEIAEGVLFERAINGYEELTLGKDGECIARKWKYCPKSLLEYLKANTDKYKVLSKGSAKLAANNNTKFTDSEEASSTDFEIESYDED